jgi:exodeoxyribonuclease V beta subunit
MHRALVDGGALPPFCAWHAIAEAPQKCSSPESVDSPGPAVDVQLPAGNLLPVQTDYRHRKISLESFSSIGHRVGSIPVGPGPQASFSLLDASGRDPDEPAAPTDEGLVETDTPDELPGGTRMGSMFHHIFENIDFGSVMDGPIDILTHESVRLLITAAMDYYRIDTRWKARIAQLVAATLRMPIELDGEWLSLGRLKPEQRRHEMEFYYPLADQDPGIRQSKGYCLTSDGCGSMVIRGFIDLVFLWRDRYYIVDWKSNRLEAGYHQDAMAREIATAGYELQYMLYTIATLRWLKQRIGRRFDPHRHFGGALYVFIRGSLAGASGSVLHVEPQQLLPLGALEAAILKKIAGIPW